MPPSWGSSPDPATFLASCNQRWASVGGAVLGGVSEGHGGDEGLKAGASSPVISVKSCRPSKQKSVHCPPAPSLGRTDLGLNPQPGCLLSKGQPSSTAVHALTSPSSAHGGQERTSRLGNPQGDAWRPWSRHSGLILLWAPEKTRLVFQRLVFCYRDLCFHRHRLGR